MTVVDIPAAPRRGHRAFRLISLAVLLAAAPAAAQQALPMRATCVPSQPLLADVQSGASTMQEVFVDGEGDRWFVFERVADGAAMIGWINAERTVFCIVTGRTRRPTDGEPRRGA